MSPPNLTLCYEGSDNTIAMGDTRPIQVDSSAVQHKLEAGQIASSC